ncbi:hypothetical protein NDA16_003196 [Ustilago loliicola]|nr:hypothetical protein NDA16_003196 [Ustilago loliicola]
MRSTSLSSAIALGLALFASTTAVVAKPPSHASYRPSNLHRRQSATATSGSAASQESIYQTAFTDPVAAAQAANGLPYIAGQYATGSLWRYNLAGDSGQLPWNTNVPFIPEAAVNGSMDGGWEALPDIQGMDLNRTFAVAPGAVMPFYQTQAYDSTKVKRAIMIMPGKPRDCWKYTSLVQNALDVYTTNPQSSTSNPDGSPSNGQKTSADQVLIIGPCWMNADDHKAGAILDGELYWPGTQWQSGMASRGPGSTSISSYQVMDAFMDALFDKTQFPALQNVVIAGHSMGAQMVQRYATLKTASPNDANISFWIGNPGSYAWLTSDRPSQSNTSCLATYDDWAYGLDGSGVPPYARDRVGKNKQALLQTYVNRNVHYNYGLLDNGQGDTQCEASYQGANHLERGCKFVESLAGLAGGKFPATHTANFMPNVSHQDYSMLSYNISLYRLFEEVPSGSTAASAKAGSSTAKKGGSASASGGAASSAAKNGATAVLGLGAVLAFGMSLL